MQSPLRPRTLVTKARSGLPQQLIMPRDAFCQCRPVSRPALNCTRCSSTCSPEEILGSAGQVGKWGRTRTQPTCRALPTSGRGSDIPRSTCGLRLDASKGFSYLYPIHSPCQWHESRPRPKAYVAPTRALWTQPRGGQAPQNRHASTLRVGIQRCRRMYILARRIVPTDLLVSKTDITVV